METAEAIAVLAANPDYRVLHRIAVADKHVFAENVTGEACARLAVIDTETTVSVSFAAGGAEIF